MNFSTETLLWQLWDSRCKLCMLNTQAVAATFLHAMHMCLLVRGMLLHLAYAVHESHKKAAKIGLVEQLAQ